jgi:hypothetical protein
MLKIHQKQIVAVIRNAALDPNDFSREQIRNTFSIAYKGTELFFQFKRVNVVNSHPLNLFTRVLTRLLPSQLQPEVEINDGQTSSVFRYSFTIFPDYNFIRSPRLVEFKVALEAFEKWLRENVVAVKSEENIDDPWASASRGSEYFNAIPGDAEPFNISERAALARSIEDFKVKVEAAFGLSERQQAIVNSKLDTLLKAAETQNKGEWKMFAYGVVTSIIINLAFDHEQGLRLYSLFVESMKIVNPILFLP